MAVSEGRGRGVAGSQPAGGWEKKSWSPSECCEAPREVTQARKTAVKRVREAPGGKHRLQMCLMSVRLPAAGWALL